MALAKTVIEFCIPQAASPYNINMLSIPDVIPKLANREHRKQYTFIGGIMASVLLICIDLAGGFDLSGPISALRDEVQI